MGIRLYSSEHDLQGLDSILDEVVRADQALENGTSKGSEFLGWVRLPEDIDEGIISQIEETASIIRENSSGFVIIGIGGSYLGARAVIEAFKRNEASTEIYYAGQHLGSDYYVNLLKALSNEEVSLNVISKSGTTLEPAIGFRILRSFMEEKYKDKMWERVIITTDSKKGALRELANTFKCKSFIVPDDIGGRYSVLTPVGLLPIAVAGIDIRELIKGARDVRKQFSEVTKLEDNSLYLYAALRNLYYRQGKRIELLSIFEPKLHYIGEWWKQLFGESEGKDAKGLYPSICDFTTDLHSMGQYIQEGPRDLVETFLIAPPIDEAITIKEDNNDFDGLNYLAGKDLAYINTLAFEGTRQAHIDGGVPCITISIERLDAYHIGGLLYFFEYACGISAQLLGVNPFNQPGVEAYKKNIFKLLGKG